VGFGGRGRGLARFWQGIANARIVAVADLIPELRDKAREALGDVAIFETHEDMLAKEDLDVVTIATTGRFHAAITHDVCVRGVRGIYCEKPMACSLADADQMIADCAASGTILTIGHERRWMEQITRVRSAIKEGAIGRPTHGYTYWATGRVGSNGSHFIDAINVMLDSNRVEDHPTYRTRLTDDPGAMGFVTYADGFRMAVDCMNDVLLPYTYMFCGTKGRLDLEEIAWRVDYCARDEDTRSHRDAWKVPQRREFPPLPEYVDGVAEQAGYRELLDCIETGKRPVSSGEDGRSALETIVAFHRSADAGMRPIRLPLAPSARDYQLKIH
jgi:predicted dehydrogenase